MEFLHYLVPQYDGRNSFYGKARVYRNNEGAILLKSYETIVAEIHDAITTEDNQEKVIIHGWYSATTARHINEFLQQHGYPKMSKKEMEGGEI